MQVVIGGAHNGKREYVRKTLLHVDPKNIVTFEGELPNNEWTKKDYVIIGNFEQIISQYDELNSEEEVVEKIVNHLLNLEDNTNVICICTDIGRGIVPLQKEDRRVRDTCGRLYQWLFQHCDSVVRVWYGIPQNIKGGN